MYTQRTLESHRLSSCLDVVPGRKNVDRFDQSPLLMMMVIMMIYCIGGNVCNDGAVSSGGSSSSISSRNNSILSSRTNSNTMGVAGDVVFHASPEVSPTIMPHSNDSGDGNGDGDADVTDSAVKTTTTMAAATMTTTTTPSSRSSGEENHGLLPDPPASTAAERAPSSDRAPSTVISCSSADCDVGGVVAPTSAAMGGTVMDSRDGGEVPREESLRPGVVARSSSVEGGERGGGAEEEGGEASRRNGKSVEAKGSTGVSPMQKRNRRELKVSCVVLGWIVLGYVWSGLYACILCCRG